VTILKQSEITQQEITCTFRQLK